MNPTDAEIRELICRVLMRVAELPGRSSPEDWPEAMLVTAEELGAIVRNESSPLAMDVLRLRAEVKKLRELVEKSSVRRLDVAGPIGSDAEMNPRRNVAINSWIPWTDAPHEAVRAWDYAGMWLSDFGIFLDENGNIPDAVASTNKPDVYAFRVDSAGKSIIVLVEIDEDGSLDGRTKCSSVEVYRG